LKKVGYTNLLILVGTLHESGIYFGIVVLFPGFSRMNSREPRVPYQIEKVKVKYTYLLILEKFMVDKIFQEDLG